MSERLVDDPASRRSLAAELLVHRSGPARAADEVRWLHVLWSLGGRLRVRHAHPPDPAPAPPRWRVPAGLPAPYRRSLREWSVVLADGGVPVHGALMLDRIDAHDPDTAGTGARPPVVAHPAVDLGAVVGDLHWFGWHRPVAEPRLLERLQAAFLTGYRGLPPERTVDPLALSRSAALRVSDRVAGSPGVVGGNGDGAEVLLRRLVEQTWMLSG